MNKKPADSSDSSFILPEGLSGKEADVPARESQRSVACQGADAEPNVSQLFRQLGTREQSLPVDLVVAPVQLADLAKARDPPRQEPFRPVLLGLDEHGPIFALPPASLR